MEWRGLIVFARRTKACAFRKILYVTLFFGIWNFSEIFWNSDYYQIFILKLTYI